MTPVGKRLAPIFLLGCLLGALAGAWCQRLAFHNYWKQGPNAERFQRKLAIELQLDEAQKKQVAAILEAQRAKIVALHQEASSKVEGLRQEMRTELRGLLRPDQQQRFAEMTARWDKAHPNRDAIKP